MFEAYLRPGYEWIIKVHPIPFGSTPNRQISVGYHLQLCVAMTFYQHNVFYHPSYIIFVSVHDNYLSYLDFSLNIIVMCICKWQPTLIRQEV